MQFRIGLLFLSVVLVPHSFFSQSTSAQQKTPAEKPIKAMLVTGGCCHDYEKQKKIITEGISARTQLKIEWTIVHQGGNTTDTKIPLYQNKDWAKGYDIVIHNECFAAIGDKEWIERVLKPHREGVNAIVIHCAMHTFRNFKENGYRDFLGVTSRSHGPHHSYKVENLQPEDPIMKGFGKQWSTPQGELYYVDNISSKATPLARAFSSGGRKQQEVCIWKNTFGKARVFGTTIGHHNATMSTSKYLDFLTRGFLWAVDRLDEKNIKKVAVKKVPINLAFNKAATCSANQDGHLPRGATDGSLETRYCADNNEPGDWFQVDLGKTEKVTGVQVYWEQSGRLYRFKLEGSVDGKNWSLLHDGSKNKSREQVQTYKFAADVRYVRMSCTETESGAWYSFWEFRVQGTELVDATEQSVSNKQPISNPASLISDLKVPSEFDAKIFAAPPEVNYPVCLTSTHDGVVYVGVDKNGSLDRKEGRGSVVRCVDQDGDGVADEFVTFCEVDSPRGLVWDRNKLFVLHPPDLSVYFDDDGDGKADRKETLVKGIGFGLDFRGADHTTNGIRMGIDGWIYVAVGDYGFIEATAKDGKTLQFKGGGVVRVRPDGTDLEVYCKGLRNICDIAIDPTMNIFTRDNTNDGGGWDIRLSHIIQSANYGYPSLYKNFNREIMPPLADYGGGSGTGALFVSEEHLPAKYRRALFTCDWGRNRIFYHPLEPSGATFRAQQEDFLTLSRPTDMDVDALGNLYVASWRGGRFKFEGENIGYVAILSPKNAQVEKSESTIFDLPKLSLAQLVDLLDSQSQSLLWAVVRELVHRDQQASIQAFARDKLTQIIGGESPLANKVAAISVGGPELAQQLLPNALQNQDLKLAAILIRFAADRKRVDEVTRSLIVSCLERPDPQLQMSALIALGRVGSPDTQAAVLKFGQQIRVKTASVEKVKTPVNTSAKALRHVTVQTLAKIGNVNELLNALSSTAIQPGQNTAAGQLALDALKYIHTQPAVEGIITYLNSHQADQNAWETLIRLYHQEGPYTGDWWGTRPDTTGPYYKRIKWTESDRIGSYIKQKFAGLARDEQLFVQAQLLKHRVKLPGMAAMVKSAGSKSSPSPIVKIPAFNKNDPNQLGNIAYRDLLARIEKVQGQVKRGQQLFKQQNCAACHTIKEGELAVGPQLLDIGLRYNRKELIESIVQPGAKIAQGFTTQLIATDDGLTHTGFVTREAGNEVEIRTAEGKAVVIPKDSIEARKDSKNSVMPDGLVNNLTVQELASLVTYLQSLKTKKGKK